MLTQLVRPKLTTQSKAGWCLWFQEEDFGTPHMYATAHEAWVNAQYKHPDQQPPKDVCVPVFWSYAQNGVEYDHIADSVPGKGIFSSPLDSAFGSEWYPSIQAMIDRIKKIDPKSRYLGWSEDLAGIRIVKEQDMPERAYNSGDAVNIAALIGYPTEAMKNKVDWNDAFYSSVKPEFEKLKQKVTVLEKTNCTPDERAYLDAMYKVNKVTKG